MYRARSAKCTPAAREVILRGYPTIRSCFSSVLLLLEVFLPAAISSLAGPNNVTWARLVKTVETVG